MVAACIEVLHLNFGGARCAGGQPYPVRWGRGKALSSPKKSSENQNGSGVRYAFMKQDSLCDACARNLIAQQQISRRRGEKIELRFQVEPLICVEFLHNFQG